MFVQGTEDAFFLRKLQPHEIQLQGLEASSDLRRREMMHYHELQGHNVYSVFCHHQILILFSVSCPFGPIALFIQCRVTTSTVLIQGDLLLRLGFALCLCRAMDIFTKFLAIVLFL